MHLKLKQKPRCLKTTHFWIRFLNGFSSFWRLKTKAKSSNFRTLIENANFVKIMVFPRENCYFCGSQPQKSTKIGCSNAVRNNVEKKTSDVEFGNPFGLPKLLQIGPQTDVKRSLFRDAMGITRNSSEVNGGQSFCTAKIATHMIRSYQSINQLICPSSP